MARTRFIATFALLAAAALCLDATRAQTHAQERYGAAPTSIKDDLDRLVRAYPDTIASHDGNFLILAHLIRNAAGGKPVDALAFARRELFAPLGMNNVTLQLDSAGTIEGSSNMLASARDWARFGQLYLNDGVVGGKRILPEGWVNYSASATPNAWVGIGAGFWTNQSDGFGANFRVTHG